MQNCWTFEERAALASRAFNVWKSLRNNIKDTHAKSEVENSSVKNEKNVSNHLIFEN